MRHPSEFKMGKCFLEIPKISNRNFLGFKSNFNLSEKVVLISLIFGIKGNVVPKV
jgi:hypothetical protein